MPDRTRRQFRQTCQNLAQNASFTVQADTRRVCLIFGAQAIGRAALYQTIRDNAHLVGAISTDLAYFILRIEDVGDLITQPFIARNESSSTQLVSLIEIFNNTDAVIYGL